MSPKLPRVAAKALLRALERGGWFVARKASGSHLILRHPSVPGRTSVATHPGEVVKPKTLAQILKDTGLTVEECIARAEEVIAAYIEDLVARGEPVPVERRRPQAITIAAGEVAA